MKASVIILCFLTLQIFASSDNTEEEADFFFGRESFVEDKQNFIFVRCQKNNEKFEKVCHVTRINDIFNAPTPIRCPAILESQRRNTVVGSNIKVLVFGDDRAIIIWSEKYEHSGYSMNEVFFKITIIEFNNCYRRDVEISIQFEENKDPDYYLDKVYLFTNDANDTIFAADFAAGFVSNINRRIINSEGIEIKESEFWCNVPFPCAKIVGIVPIKRGNMEQGFLVFTNFHQTYLMNEKGSKVQQLNIVAEDNSKVIYSTDHDSISFCYHTDSFFSCGRFTNTGEIIMKRRFKLTWKAMNPIVHSIPDFGLILISYSDSESCGENMLKQHITYITNVGIVESRDLDCQSADFTDIPQFYHNGTNDHCMLKVNLKLSEIGEAIQTKTRCFPSLSIDIHNEVSQWLKTMPILYQ